MELVGQWMNAQGKRGRRAGGRDTRATLLAAAREVFTEQGYDAATVRAIAQRAGVDAAMVNHWFGGKDALFSESISLPLNPAEVLGHLIEGDPEQIAERLLYTFLRVWDEAEGGQFVAMIRSVTTHEAALRALREFVVSMLGQLLARLGVDQPELRASLCGAQIIGLGFVRYVARVEPLASAEHETVVTAIALNLQRYFTARLDASSGT